MREPQRALLQRQATTCDWGTFKNVSSWCLLPGNFSIKKCLHAAQPKSLSPWWTSNSLTWKSELSQSGKNSTNNWMIILSANSVKLILVLLNPKKGVPFSRPNLPEKVFTQETAHKILSTKEVMMEEVPPPPRPFSLTAYLLWKWAQSNKKKSALSGLYLVWSVLTCAAHWVQSNFEAPTLRINLDSAGLGSLTLLVSYCNDSCSRQMDNNFGVKCVLLHRTLNVFYRLWGPNIYSV